MRTNSPLISSNLFDETTFYQTFINDLKSCKKEVIIESPYITTQRMKLFRSVFDKLLSKGVKIYIVTRNPLKHEESMAYQAEKEIAYFERIGIQGLLCNGNLHRKLAILDKSILWEGSLNILSQTYSREIMRRIDNADIAMQMFDFLKFSQFI